MAFLKEWQGEWRKGLEVVPIISEEDGDWTGEKGVVSEEIIEKYKVLEGDPVFFAAGPPGFVAKVWQVLKKAGADEDDIRTEEFPGYR
jgi:NAD(P)H-flavin reductase